MADLDLQLVVGSKGDKGDTGAKGDKGDKGDKGEKGEKGATGATGPQGARGEAGPIGATGPQGPAGSGVVESSAAGIIAHAEDAFAGSSILGLTIEGAYSQQTTTGLQLIDAPKTTIAEAGASVTFDGEYYTIKNTSTARKARQIRLNTHIPAGSDGTRYAMYVQGGRTKVSVHLGAGDTDLLFIRDTGTKANESAVITQDIDTISFGIPANTPEFKLKVICAVGSSVTTWEPYTGGKPSPSPDYPQDITVIENPTVKVVGRNLANPAEAYYFFNSESKAEQIAGGFKFTVTDDRTRIIAIPCCVKKGDTIVVNFDTRTISGTGGVKLYFPALDTYLNQGIPHVMEGDASSIAVYIDSGSVGEYEITNFRMSRNVDDGYKPHTSQTLTFALPAEHPYLAKLPDGTADTIEVDSEGNATLVARATKVQFLKSDSFIEQNLPAAHTHMLISYGPGSRHRLRKYISTKAGLVNKGTVTAFSASEIAKYGSAYGVGELFWFVPYINEGLSDFNAYEFLKDVDLYLPLAEEVRYKLEPIDMPAAPDNIINVWTDAELTTQSTVNYFVEAGKQVSINRERIKKLEQEGPAGIEVPMPISKGGTGATDAAGAIGALMFRGWVRKGSVESFDDATDIGVYTVDISNLPSANGPEAVYKYGILEVYGAPNSTRIQRYTPEGTYRINDTARCIYERQYWGGSWSAWASRSLHIAAGLARTAINGAETVHVNVSTVDTGTLPLAHGGTGATNTIEAAAKLNVPYIGAPDSSIEIPKGADLNAYTTIGATYCISNLLLVGSLKNCPVSVPFSMFVSSALGTTVIRQTLVAFNTPRIFSRIYASSNSTWSSWEAVGAGIRSIGNGLSLSDAGVLSAPEQTASSVDLSKATGTLPLKNGGTGVTSKNALIDSFYLLGLGNHGTISRLLDSKSVTQPKAPGRWYVPAVISQEMNDTSSLGKKPALLPDGFFVTAEAMTYTGSEYGNAGNNGFRWTVEAPSGIVWVSDSTNTTWRCLTPIVRLDISSISNSTAIVPSMFWSDLLGRDTRVVDPASTKDIMRVLAPFTIQLSYPTVSSLTWANSWVQVGGIQATTTTGTAIINITLAALTKGSSGYTAGLLNEHDDYMLRPIGMPISFNTHASFANYTGLPALPAIFANM